MERDVQVTPPLWVTSIDLRFVMARLLVPTHRDAAAQVSHRRTPRPAGTVREDHVAPALVVCTRTELPPSVEVANAVHALAVVQVIPLTMLVAAKAWTVQVLPAFLVDAIWPKAT